MELITTEKPTKSRILWAVDAFSMEPEYESKGLDWILSFTKGQYDEIEPVFILDDLEAGKTSQHPDAITQLNYLTAAAGVPKLKNPRILDSIEPPYFSEPQLTDVLLKYAKETGSMLIVAHSASSPALKRAFVGSFAESLIDHSAIPLILLGRNLPSARPIRKIGCLFDGSPQAQITLLTAMNHSKKLNAEVRILEAQPTAADRLFHPTQQIEDPRFFLQALEKAASDLNRLITHRLLPLSGRLTDTVMAAIEADEIDLMAIPRPTETAIVSFPWDLPVVAKVPIWMP